MKREDGVEGWRKEAETAVSLLPLDLSLKAKSRSAISQQH